jgi:hypothetical protein
VAGANLNSGGVLLTGRRGKRRGDDSSSGASGQGKTCFLKHRQAPTKQSAHSQAAVCHRRYESSHHVAQVMVSVAGANLNSGGVLLTGRRGKRRGDDSSSLRLGIGVFMCVFREHILYYIQEFWVFFEGVCCRWQLFPNEQPSGTHVLSLLPSEPVNPDLAIGLATQLPPTTDTFKLTTHRLSSGSPRP